MYHQHALELFFEFVLNRNAMLKEGAFFEEMEVSHGVRRVDLAYFGEHSYAIEIKTSRDTLSRLEKQLTWYSKAFDFVYVFCARKHTRTVSARVEKHVGVIEFDCNDSRPSISIINKARQSPETSIDVISSWLWREELLNALELRGAAAGFRSKAKGELRKRIGTVYSNEELRSYVFDCLRKRENAVSVSKDAVA